jgi:hypothetical protein
MVREPDCGVAANIGPRKNSFEKATVVTGATPALLRISRNCSVKSVDGSWIKKRMPSKMPSEASVRLRAVYNIHVSPGSGTMPAKWISRHIKRLTKST